VVLRMIQPWENPRSKFYWFRRRVPMKYRRFGLPSEIKFSLATVDWDEAVIRCQEENLKLEREWRANLIGKPPDQLSHLQITALAGEFYAETVAGHRDEPGIPKRWQDSLSSVAEVKSRRIRGQGRPRLRQGLGRRPAEAPGAVGSEDAGLQKAGRTQGHLGRTEAARRNRVPREIGRGKGPAPVLPRPARGSVGPGRNLP
jgi:hypothetical protein